MLYILDGRLLMLSVFLNSSRTESYALRYAFNPTIEHREFVIWGQSGQTVERFVTECGTTKDFVDSKTRIPET